MPATDEQKACLYLLHSLLRKGEDWVCNDDGSLNDPTAKLAFANFTPLNRRQLDDHLLYRGRRGQFKDDQAIYVEPPQNEKSTLATLWARWDFDQDPPKCGFYFGLWSPRPPFPPNHPPDELKYPAFVGYRFETPEDYEQHNFFHAQPCRSLVSMAPSLPCALPVSVRNPTWPLAASSAIELLLCLTISLYGMTGFLELQDEIQNDPVTRANLTLTRAMANILRIRRD